MLKLTYMSVIENCDKTLISDTQGRIFSDLKIKIRRKGKERKNYISWGKDDRTSLFVNSYCQLK